MNPTMHDVPRRSPGLVPGRMRCLPTLGLVAAVVATLALAGCGDKKEKTASQTAATTSATKAEIARLNQPASA